MVKKILQISLVIIAPLISVFNLGSFGLPPTHDGEYHVIRFYEFYKALADGNIFPRWAQDLNNGFGIPLFTYVYPLPNYLASLFHFLGIGFIDAFKLNLVFATVFGSVFMYLWVKEKFGNEAGIVSSVFYTFSPYRIVDIYIRGSVGEVWAIAIFPALMWATGEMHKKLSWFTIILCGVLFALLIFSHNILAFVFVLFYTVYIVLSFRKKKLLIGFFIVYVLGFALSAVFWIPAIFERGYVVGLNTYNIKDNFVEIYQFVVPTWGTGFSGTGVYNQMSFQIGAANLFVVIGILFMLIRKKIEKEKINLTLFFLFSLFAAVFLMTSYSQLAWDIFPILSYVQFPWRLLSLVVIICAFLAGVLFQYSNFKLKKVFFIIFCAIPIILSFGYIKVPYYLKRNDSYYLTRSNFIDGTNSIGNAFNTKWFDPSIPKKKGELHILEGASIKEINLSSTNRIFAVWSKEKINATLSLAYFPGWQVYVNGIKNEAKINREGLISFSVPKGGSHIAVKLEQTGLQRFASFITVASFFAVVAALSFLVLGIIKKR